MANNIGRFVFLIGGLLAMQCSSIAQETPAPAKIKRDERLSRETAEGTLRAFTLGVMISNEQLIRLTAGDIPEEDLKYLISPRQQNQPSDKELKERCASMKVRELKVGEKFKLPHGEEIEVPLSDVSEDRKVLLLEGAPVPTRMYKMNGYWWVDPSPVVAARKAAAKARANQKPKTGSK